MKRGWLGRTWAELDIEWAKRNGFAAYIHAACFYQTVFGVRNGVEILPRPIDCSQVAKSPGSAC